MNTNLIDIIGFFACAIVIYAWIESLPKSKKKRLEEKEKMNKAKKELFIAIKKEQEKKIKER